MKKDKDQIAILAHLKQMLEEKILIYTAKKSELKSEYKKYKQLIRIEKKLATIFQQTYGKDKLQEYKKMFQADKLQNKIYALYFQTKILGCQIHDLKEFFDDEYYSSMKHIAKAICNNSKEYNYFNYKQKLIDDLDLIARGISSEKVNKNLFDSFNNGKEKINIINL